MTIQQCLIPETYHDRNLLSYVEEPLRYGDVALRRIYRALGYHPVPVSEAVDNGTIAWYDSCLFGSGDLLTRRNLGKAKINVTLWGSGYSGDQKLKERDLEGCKVKLVRGERTRRFLNVDAPLGDPLLLTGSLIPVESCGVGGVLSTGDTVLTDTQFVEFTQALVNSTMVFTDSPRVAAVAHSYGVPWVARTPSSDPLKFSWEDFMSGLPKPIKPKFFPEADDSSRKWATQIMDQHRIDRKAVQQLLSTFPYEIVKD